MGDGNSESTRASGSGLDVGEVCPRDAIDAQLEDLCGRDAIEQSVEDLCGRAAIDEATADLCGREAIEQSVEDLCGREAIEEAAAGLCAKPVPPVIGLVPTQIPGEHILRVNDYYINSIVLSGGVPLIFPLTYNKQVYERLFGVVDGFLLTGGQDVDPQRYGATPDSPGYDKIVEITPLRDTVETTILDYAYTYDVPCLGICRGMQTMNVYFGGTLYTDLDTEFAGRDALSGKPIKHWQDEETTEVSHYIDVVRGSKLRSILKADSSACNSFHHQGIKKVGEGFEVVARASDGLVEAIEMRGLTFMLGVQWHPEFFLGDKHMGNLFSLLVHEAALARASGRLAGHDDYHIDSMAEKEPDHGVALVHALKKSYTL